MRWWNSFMRFRSVVAVLCALAAGSVHATPESVKADLVQRLQAQWPQVPLADVALGAAAFDSALRAEVEAQGAEGTAAAAAGKARWDRRFKDGRSLANCFPNGGRRVAGTYPLFDPKLKRVITFET